MKKLVSALSLTALLSGPALAQDTTSCTPMDVMRHKDKVEYSLADVDGRKVVVSDHGNGFRVAMGYLVKGSITGDGFTIQPLPVKGASSVDHEAKQRYDSQLGAGIYYTVCKNM